MQRLKVGKTKRGRRMRAGGRPGQGVGSLAAGRGAGGAEGGGAGCVFGALQQGGWRPLGRAGRVCARALPLWEEDGPGGKVGVTRAAPGRSPGGTEASPTEPWPPRLGDTQSGHHRHVPAPSLQVAVGAPSPGGPGGAGGRARRGARLRDGLRTQHPCLPEWRDLLPGLG